MAGQVKMKAKATTMEIDDMLAKEISKLVGNQAEWDGSPAELVAALHGRASVNDLAWVLYDCRPALAAQKLRVKWYRRDGEAQRLRIRRV
jgi:hypothetical protein